MEKWKLATREFKGLKWIETINDHTWRPTTRSGSPSLSDRRSSGKRGRSLSRSGRKSGGRRSYTPGSLMSSLSTERRNKKKVAFHIEAMSPTRKCVKNLLINKNKNILKRILYKWCYYS